MAELAASHRIDVVQAGTRIEQQIACGQLQVVLGYSGNQSQLIVVLVCTIFLRLSPLEKELTMSCQQLKSSANASRSLASEVGVTIATMSAGHMAQAAESVEDTAVALGATGITGEHTDTAYKTDDSTSKQYTAPLRDKRYFDQVFQTHYAHVAAGRTALMGVNFHF
jgi:hypothetical protein